MKYLIFFFLLVGSPAAAETRAAWNPEIASVPVAQCSVQEVTSRMEMQGISGAARVATAQLPLIHEISKIGEKAKDDERSVGEQISQPDLVRFVEISQQIKVGNLGLYIESRRERDARALQKLVQIADLEYRFSNNRVEDADIPLRELLHAFRAIAEREGWTLEIDIQAPNTCSFQLAAKALSEEALAKIDGDATSASAAALENIAKSYGMKTIDPEKLSEADRGKFYRIRRDLAGAISTSNYLHDLRDLALLAQAMDINYRAMQQDVIASGGDMNEIGKTVDRMAAEGLIDLPTQTAFRVLSILNEKVPADFIKN